eukprot:5669180-Amphidinium_carterae.1
MGLGLLIFSQEAPTPWQWPQHISTYGVRLSRSDSVHTLQAVGHLLKVSAKTSRLCLIVESFVDALGGPRLSRSRPAWTTLLVSNVK